MSNTDMSNSRCPVNSANCPLAEAFRSLEKEVEQLRQLVRVDTLTNYFNYRYFREALNIEMERTRRTGLPTGLIMIDLDHFKSTNDNYGHEVGNMVLISATQLWRTQIRRIDIPCRYGGEEFAVIIPGTRFPMVVRVAERLRSALSAAPLNIKAQEIALTASFGVDCFNSDESATLDEFVDRTDQHLLKAKRNGRNQVCFDSDRMDNHITEISIDERKQLFHRFAVNQDNTDAPINNSINKNTKD